MTPMQELQEHGVTLVARQFSTFHFVMKRPRLARGNDFVVLGFSILGETDVLEKQISICSSKIPSNEKLLEKELDHQKRPETPVRST